MKPALIITLLIITLCSAALAQDQVDPEALFHQSYIQEVVQGQVSMAALGYLKLMNDEAVPAPLRTESRFRFAICCVLLGRPDEARNHLTLLLDDESAPASAQNRAKEYLASLQGLGTGTELSKKLEDLAFELGRSKLSNGSKVITPPTYRDFQIIGEPAVPFLKELLSHPDRSLQQHAFRVLLRMDVPGLAKIWDPKRFDDFSVKVDLVSYLGRSDTERQEFEEAMLSLSGEEVLLREYVIGRFRNWSLGFVSALGEKDGCAELAAGLAVREPYTPEKVNLILHWLHSGKTGLEENVAGRLSNYATARNGEAFLTPECYLRVVRIFCDQELDWKDGSRHGKPDHYPREGEFARYSEAMDPATLMQALANLVDIAEKWEGDLLRNPLANGLAEYVAYGLLRKGGARVSFASLSPLVLRWMKVRTGEEFVPYNKDHGYGFPNGTIGSLARRVLFDLPAADATQFVAEYLRLHPERDKAGLFNSEWGIRRPGDVETLLTAIRMLGPEKGGSPLVSFLRQRPEFIREPAEVVNAEVLAAMLELSKGGADSDLRNLISLLPQAAVEVKPELAIETVVALAPRLQQVPEQQLSNLVFDLLDVHASDNEKARAFRRHVAIPALQPLWEATDGQLRETVTAAAMTMLRAYRDRLKVEESLPLLCEFLREHLDELTANHQVQLVPYREHIPLDLLVPRVGESIRSGTGNYLFISEQEADAAAYRLAIEPAKVNQQVLVFLRKACSPLTRRSILEKMVAESRGEDLTRMVGDLNSKGGPVTPEILSQKLHDLLEAKDADIVNVATLAEMVARASPSEKLFPAVTYLLESWNKEAILAGSRIAMSLGRTELLDPLSGVLSSMDPEVRNAAKSAMDSIRELQKLRDEQKLRDAGMLPR